MAFGTPPRVIYSIQNTYIINLVSKPGKVIATCNQRIDIPTIEPWVTAEDEASTPVAIIPCIELAADFMRVFNFTFETNEGVTVLPVEIEQRNNPDVRFRYVLVLPRGSTGVKSCKLTHKTVGFELQHNFTFGIMPPPYNYDNALFENLFYRVGINADRISNLEDRVTALENKAGV